MLLCMLGPRVLPVVPTPSIMDILQTQGGLEELSHTDSHLSIWPAKLSLPLAQGQSRWRKHPHHPLLVPEKTPVCGQGRSLSYPVSDPHH